MSASTERRPAIAEQRCLNHAGREAVALCPSCRNYYCRECVADHEGRVMCATCLAGLQARGAGRRRRGAWVRPLAALAAFGLVWVCFLMLGRTLLELPDTFHSGAIWSIESEPDPER